jgi:glycosyltransferase involved in cell wall biosynthesis
VVRRIAERAESWRFVAEHLAQGLARSVPADVARAVERVTRIEASAIDVESPSPGEIAEKRSRVGQPFAVCVGRLVALKRVDAAIAWASSAKRTLVVVGDGPERAALERVARSAATRVLFVGTAPRREALAWIAASDLVVSASSAEGLSTVKREADALGVTFVSIQSGS